MHPTTARVAAALKAAGVQTEIREFGEATRTAQQAADTLGVPVGAIVKSLCFMADDEPVMVLVSGANRADMPKVEQALGAAIVTRASAAQVRTAPPIGYTHRLRMLLDRDLLGYEELWAAAGTPHSVFRLTPAQLVELTGGEVADIAAVGGA